MPAVPTCVSALPSGTLNVSCLSGLVLVPCSASLYSYTPSSGPSRVSSASLARTTSGRYRTSTSALLRPFTTTSAGTATCLSLLLPLSFTSAGSGLVMVTRCTTCVRTGHASANVPLCAAAVAVTFRS